MVEGINGVARALPGVIASELDEAARAVGAGLVSDVVPWTRESADAALTAAFRTESGGFNREALTTIAELQTLPDGVRPPALDGLEIPTASLAPPGDGGEMWRPASTWFGWDGFDAARAQQLYSDPAARATRWEELIAKPSYTLSRDELHDLNGLGRLPRDTRPAAFYDSNLNGLGETAENIGTTEARGADAWGWDYLERARADHSMPTEAERLAVLEELAELPVEAWTQEAWERFSRVTLGSSSESQDPRLVALGRSGNLQKLVKEMVAGTGTGDFYARSVINETVAGYRYPTAASASEALERLLTRDPAALTPAELHELDGLVRLGDDRRPAVLSKALWEDADASRAAIKGPEDSISRLVVDRLNGMRDMERALAGTADRDAGIIELRRLANAEVLEIAENIGTELPPETMRRLAPLMALPDAIRPSVFDGVLREADFLHLAADGAYPGAPRKVVEPLDRMRVVPEALTTETATAHLDDILDRPNESLTSDDWFVLGAIGDMDAAARPELLRGGALPDGWDAGRAVRSGSVREGWYGFEMLDDLRELRAAPTEPAERAAALDALRTRHTNELERIAATPYRDIARDDWFNLARITSLPDAIRPTDQVSFDTISHAGSLFMQRSRPAKGWDGWSALNSLQANARYRSIDEARAGLEQLLLIRNQNVRPDDVHAVDGIMHLGEARRPVPYGEWPGGDIGRLAETARVGAVDHPAYAALDELRISAFAPDGGRSRADLLRELFENPHERAAVRDAILARRASDVPTDLDRAAVFYDAERQMSYVRGWGEGNTQRFVQPLETARAAFATVDADHPLRATVDTMVPLVDEELERAGRGAYADWASYGRIQSTLELLGAIEEPPATTAAADVLTW